MKFTYLSIILATGMMLMSSCSSTSDATGGTETGSTDASNTTEVASHIDDAASALVLSLDDSGSDSSVSALSRYAINGSSSEWDTYLEPENSYVLTDVFGSADVEPRVVTKIRVLLEQFQNDTVDTLVATDPDFDCTGAAELAEGDTIEIAFYGDIANGSAEDRFFDCVSADTDQTNLYGRDESGNLYIVQMTSTTQTNTEQAETRGDEVKYYIVVRTTYGEAEEDGVTAGYLDLQFAHATIYNGVDGSFGTGDDMTFKSHTRITGRVSLDSDGNISAAAGEFNSLKYDSAQNEDESTYTIVTQSMGRGDFTAGGYSLFKVDSDVDGVEDLNRTFCIQSPEAGTGLPSAADAANCTALETALAWGTTTFPFTIDPAISATFEDNDFFDGNDTDLPANDGSNFTIPTY